MRLSQLGGSFTNFLRRKISSIRKNFFRLFSANVQTKNQHHHPSPPINAVKTSAQHVPTETVAAKTLNAPQGAGPNRSPTEYAEKGDISGFIKTYGDTGNVTEEIFRAALALGGRPIFARGQLTRVIITHTTGIKTFPTPKGVTAEQFYSDPNIVHTQKEALATAQLEELTEIPETTLKAMANIATFHAEKGEVKMQIGRKYVPTKKQDQPLLKSLLKEQYLKLVDEGFSHPLASNTLGVNPTKMTELFPDFE